MRNLLFIFFVDLPSVFIIIKQIIVELNNKEREQNKAHELLIDIEKVFATKNATLFKLIPGFIIRYLKRITHQDDINQFIYESRFKKGLEFSQAILDRYEVSYTTKKLETVPTDGRYIFVANHPLGGVDGIAFLTAVGERFKELKFPVNDILLNIKGLDNIFLPINKHGGHSRDAAITLEEAFASDNQILFFPAGLVSRKQNGVIKDLEWKKYFIKKSIQHQRDVIPVHITGQNSKFFYNLARFRKAIGIKANIEMLYLADEFYKQRGNNLTISFGEPISWQKIKAEHNQNFWAKKIRETVYSLDEKN